MKTNPTIIYNTVIPQEKVVILIVAMLFIAQPFAGIVQGAVLTLTAIGLWLIIADRCLLQSVGVWRLGAITLLLGVPILLSFCSTYSIERTSKAALLIPVLFLAGTTVYSCLCNQKLMRILVAVIVLASMFCILDCLVQFFVGVDLFGIHVL